MATNVDRLTQFDQLLNKDGTPTLRFMAIWQALCDNIEAQAARLDDLETP